MCQNLYKASDAVILVNVTIKLTFHLQSVSNDFSIMVTGQSDKMAVSC